MGEKRWIRRKVEGEIQKGKWDRAGNRKVEEERKVEMKTMVAGERRKESEKWGGEMQKSGGKSTKGRIEDMREEEKRGGEERKREGKWDKKWRASLCVTH